MGGPARKVGPTHPSHHRCSFSRVASPKQSTRWGRSVILTIKSEVRLIESEVFAGPYALRFPRIERARYDKPWYDCMDEEGEDTP